MLHTIDPKENVITIGGQIMRGFADGEYLNIELDEDLWTESTGADGDDTRVKSNNTMGLMTLTLAQSSLSNDSLSIIYNIDKNTNQGVVPILVKSVNGNTTVFSAKGYIKKLPPITEGKDVQTRAWPIKLTSAELFVGGVPAN